jgi:transglutaminase-like putative cysteine protease
MRLHPLDAALAALATLAAVLGLTTLTDNASWLGRAAWACVGVAVAGAVMRRLTRFSALIVAVQLVLVTWLVVAAFAPDDLWFGLPGPAAWDQMGVLFRDCVAVMTRYAAPIPATEGVQLVIVGAVALLALLVDLLALTLRAPAAAGLPLLAAFLTAAANSGSSLSPWYFVVAAVMWLALVARQASTTVRGWSTTVANPSSPASTTDVETDALMGFGSVARRLGVVAVLAAVVLPAVVPHLPTRYVLDGLGRNDSSVGRGGRVGFSSTLELARSLESGSQNVVLTYRSSAAGAPPPLRVVTASTYVDGQWRPRPVTTRSPLTPQTTAISPQVKVVDRQVEVESNALDAPNVSSVQPVVAADIGVPGWYTDATTGDLYSPQRPDRYGFTYREVDVTGDQLKAGIPGGSNGRADPEVQASTLPEPSIGAQIRQITDSVTRGTDNAYDAAVAIQEWLRGGGGFTYSLQLVDTATDAQGRPITDPILKFLATKQGYCVQFASAMVMMARAEGIPARMAIGFLPGTLQDGLYTVRSSDAHAWPELFFPGAGWLRFEPTPAARTGTAPAYTLPAEATPTATATATDPASGSTAAPTATLRDPGAPETDATTTDASLPLSDRIGLWFQEPSHLLVLALGLGLLGTFVLPLTAWLVNRRRRRRAADAADLAEAQWEALVSRLGDLGVQPPPGGGTLREWRRHYVREAYLPDDADAALGHLVATLERSRYARPGAVPDPLGPQIRTVTKAAAAGRPLTRRIRAFFVPADGVRWWHRSADIVLDSPGRWLGALLDRLPRRR